MFVVAAILDANVFVAWYYLFLLLLLIALFDIYLNIFLGKDADRIDHVISIRRSVKKP